MLAIKKNQAMTLPRYNGFLLIHKSLRLMLYEMATAIQHNDFAATNETKELLEQLKLNF